MNVQSKSNMNPKFLFGLGSFFLILMLLSSSLYTVNEREYAVVLQFGQPVVARKEPGLYFKVPFIQSIQRLPKTLQFTSSMLRKPLVDLPTADGKKIEVTGWATWRITDPIQFIRLLKFPLKGEEAIVVRARSAIRDVITSHSLAEVVRSTDRELTYSFRFEMPEDAADGKSQPVPEVDLGLKPQTESPVNQEDVPKTITVGRQEILRQAREMVKQKLAAVEGARLEEGRGVEIVDIGIADINFVPSVQEAAFQRLKAFMESIAAGYSSLGEQRKQEILNQTNAEVEKITGQGERQSQIIRGEVDAEIIKDYAQAIQETGDFYNFNKQLELYEAALGETGEESGDTRLILTTDSELFKLLKELEPAEKPAE